MAGDRHNAASYAGGIPKGGAEALIKRASGTFLAAAAGAMLRGGKYVCILFSLPTQKDVFIVTFERPKVTKRPPKGGEFNIPSLWNPTRIAGCVVTISRHKGLPKLSGNANAQ